MKTPVNNPVGWFEIPVTDMPRAIKFYEAVLQIKIEHRPFGELDMGWFPMSPDGKGITGALVKHAEWYKPAMDGALLYFTAHSGDLSIELARVEAAGGKVCVPRKPIGEFGFIAVFSDTEGNRVALHSRK